MVYQKEKMMNDTPMTDLYLGDGRRGLCFAVRYGAQMYHAYKYDGKGQYRTLCRRLSSMGRPFGPVTAYSEEDISPVRRPCKLCLAMLRKQ